MQLHYFIPIVHKNTIFVLLLLLFCVHAMGQDKYADNASKSSNAPSVGIAYASNTKSFGYKRMSQARNALEKQSLSSFINELGVMPVSKALATTVETLPAGTLIIAMDIALQENDNNRLRRAYGLAVRLLHAGVPLKWIIDPNKTSRTAVDLSASARLRYPSTGSYGTRNFRTGPIAIFPGYEALAATVINSFGNGIRVYELQNATSANVHSNLTHKPFVFVEQSQNPDIHTDILSAAGLSSGTHYTTGAMTSVRQDQCVTIITVPHNDDISVAERNAVIAFTRNGGNFFAQCAAVRGFQATAPRVFTNAGFIDETNLGTFLYDNAQEPSAQFEGNIADEGGSLENFGFTTAPPGGTRIVHDSRNQFKAYTGRIDGVTTSDGGYVHYLGGHDHKGNINADRFYLNAVLRSAIRPTSCNLTLCIPTINISPSNGAVCQNGNFTLNSSVSGGLGTCTIQWQSSASASGPFTNIGGANSATYTVPTSSSGTVYYRATYTCTGAGCPVSTSNVSTVVINAAPTITGTTPASRCGTGTVTLGATASAGTINWYANATGGTSLGTGTSFTTPSISSTTTYYVDATLNGCTTASRTAVIATVNAIPTITGTTPASRCGTGTVTLGATSSAGTINWYAAATGGTSLGTGTSFTTPSISTTTTYYVDATQNGCTTGSRTAVVATVNAIPTITGSTPANRCGPGTVTLGATASAGTINWYAAATGGTSLGTGTSFTTPSISTTTTYYVDATENGCTTASRTAVVATVNAIPTITGSTPANRCGPGTVTLGATASAGTINWYANATGGTSLGTGTSFTTPSIATTTTYYVDATLNGCTTASRTAVVATVNDLPTTPVATVDCSLGFGNGRIEVTSPIGANFDYSLNGGAYQANPLFTGLANGNATIIARNTTTLCTSAPATVNVNCGCVNAPTLALSSTSGSTCGIAPITISGNIFGGSATSVTVTENGAGSITSGNTSTTSPFSFTYTPAAGDISNVVTITVTTNNPLGAPCAPAVLTYTLTVNAIPTITATTPGSRCGTGTVTLGATASAGTINWYAAATGGTSLGTGTSFTTPSISSTTTYYVDATQNGCTTGSRTAVIATVNDIPTITGTTPASRCGTGTVTLGATASAGTINWYAAATGGTSLGTGTSFTTPSIATTTTYYVDATQNGCTTASRTAVVATVNQLPNAPEVGVITQPSCSTPTGSVQLNGLPSGNWTLTRSPGNVTANGNTTSTTISGLAIGTYTFTVTNSNNCTSPPSGNVVINAPECLPPIATDDFNNTPINTPVSGNVLTNDDDPKGLPLTVNTTIPNICPPQHGTVVMQANGNYTYTPNNNFVGTDKFCYVVCNSIGLCDTATVTIDIIPLVTKNSVVANDDATQTQVGVPVKVRVLANDFDPQGDKFASVTRITNPTNGTVVYNPSDSSFTYTPTSAFLGKDSFKYVLCDVRGACDTATVTIDVLPTIPGNDPPVAVDDANITKINVPVSGTVATNDSDPNNDPLTFAKLTNPANGTVTFNPNGTYTYTPNSNYRGPDRFTYRVCDNGTPNLCDTATVYITILAQPPVATDDINNTPINTPVVGNVLTNDDDPQGLPLTVNTTIPNICPPQHGTVVMQANGNYTYTPTNNFVGTDKFCYVVCNSAGLCDTATVTIDIIPLVTKNSVVANDDATQTQVGVPVKVRVLANDFDPQGDKFASVTRITNPTNGTVVYNPSDSSFTYTPTSAFLGKDSFKYVLCDVKGACDTATVTIDVLPLIPGNDPPVAVDDANITKVNVPVSGTVATNDSDPNNDPLTFAKLTNPANGTVTFNPNGTYTYTPNNNYAGPDRFTYRVCDNGTPNLCDTATVYITILAQPPVATDDINNTPINTPVVGNVLTNDDDPQGLPLTVNTTIPSICPPQHGTVVMQANGNYTYTPTNNFVGTDKFCYVVCNSAGLCDTATVTIDIIPLVTKNSVVANDDATQTQVGVPVKVRVLANDFDPQGDKFASVTRITNPTNGTVVYNPSDSSFTYTPTSAFLGKDSFKYVLCDVKGACDTATVTIDVLPLIPGNDPPVAVDDANITKINVPVSGTVATNDSDPNNDPLTFAKLTNPANGTVTFNPNGTYTYTPNNNYAGPDRFTYRVCDNGTPNLCDTATVYITVLSPDPCVKSKVTLTNTPLCSADIQTYSITFTVTGQVGILKANKGTLTGSNPYTITGIPSGATITITDSLSAVCKFDTLITGPNCNCTPTSPTILTPSFTICKGDTFPTIRATVLGLAQVEWFTTPTGGSPVFIGLNFKPAGNATADIIYYAQARITDPNCLSAVSSPRVTSTINVQDCDKEIDLALKKTINKKVAKIGDILTYTIKVWNESGNNATGVAVTDSIATTVQFQAGTFVPSRGSAAISGNVIKWSIGNIAANGDTVTLTYQVKATKEGVHFNTAQICKANEKDVDSTPCNNDDKEDDIDTECFTVPFKLCPGEKVEVRIPAKYTNVKWFKGTTEVTSIAGQSVVLLDDVGSYTFTATNKTCPAEGCCPIIIESGDNCCPAELCIPFTIQKTKKSRKPL